MDPRRFSSVADRVHLIERRQAGSSIAAASRALGFGPDWGEGWWGRFVRGGLAGLAPAPRPARGPLATFPDPVRAAVLAIRRAYPALGARRAALDLAADPALAGLALPSWRTIHRAWAAAGLVAPAPPREAPPPPPALPANPADPHAVWQIDHQDGLRPTGLATPVVLQDVRAPAAGLVVGADLFASAGGANAVALDAVLDALRRCFVRFGKPRAITVDGGLHFLGRPQRSFPSRFELVCAGLGIAVVPIRPGRPTDHGAVERQHRTLDAVLLGPPYPDLPAAQAALDRHVALLNERFPSRARVCAGKPPLAAHPAARHSGRPYDPAAEWERFDLAAVDALLGRWTWLRRVGRTGQISFANRNVGVGRGLAGTVVSLRFDPADRHVAIFAPGAAPAQPGPEVRRFPCRAFTKDAILGRSTVAPQPPTPGGSP
jgi:transposase InsO family protein